MAGSYFATSLTFIFYLFKDCVCSPGCSLSRPLVAAAGDGSEGIAIHSEDWWLRWKSGHWTGLHGLSWQPAEWPAQVSWLGHSAPWSNPADSILPLRPRTFSGLTLPTLTFCGSSTPKLTQRSSCGPVYKKVSLSGKGLQTFLCSMYVPSPQYLPIQVQCLWGQVKSWAHMEPPWEPLSTISSVLQSDSCVSPASPWLWFLKGEINSSVPQPIRECLVESTELLWTKSF